LNLPTTTKHGLHLNELGKELPSNQLVLHILSVLQEVKVNANVITLGWYDKNLHVNVPSIDRTSHALTPTNYQLLTEQAPKRIKKLPVTRKDDFLGAGNLTEELGFNRVNDCNELKQYKNQIQVNNFSIPKGSKKIMLFFTKT
jgi:hypothetical protein